MEEPNAVDAFFDAINRKQLPAAVAMPEVGVLTTVFDPRANSAICDYTYAVNWRGRAISALYACSISHESAAELSTTRGL